MTDDKLLILIKLFGLTICIVVSVTIIFFILTGQKVISKKQSEIILYSCLSFILLMFATFISFLIYLNKKSNIPIQKRIILGANPDLVNTINEHFECSSI